jgi:hypothetical protein
MGRKKLGIYLHVADFCESLSRSLPHAGKFQVLFFAGCSCELRKRCFVVAVAVVVVCLCSYLLCAVARIIIVVAVII